MNILTTKDIAKHFKISERRARALIENRHARLGIGQKIAGIWFVKPENLHLLTPDEKHKRKER